ncbi:unnamed protein product [Caenorhabditis brenneri]
MTWPVLLVVTVALGVAWNYYASRNLPKIQDVYTEIPVESGVNRALNDAPEDEQVQNNGAVDDQAEINGAEGGQAPNDVPEDEPAPNNAPEANQAMNDTPADGQAPNNAAADNQVINDAPVDDQAENDVPFHETEEFSEDNTHCYALIGIIFPNVLEKLNRCQHILNTIRIELHTSYRRLAIS